MRPVEGGEVLTIRDVWSGYNSVTVLRGVELEIGRGEVVSVLGRNGAGKTTLLKTIMGIVPAQKGRILLEDRDELVGLPSNLVASAGVGYVPQGRAIFSALTVAENLSVARFAKNANGRRIEDLLETFPMLKPLLNLRGGGLSGGQQQILAIARALVGQPTILLLDEPSEGIQPSILDTILEVLANLRRQANLSILLVEQNLDFAGSLSDRAYVMEIGSIVGTLGKHELADAGGLARQLMSAN